MDFSLDETHRDLQELANRIISAGATQERLKQIEADALASSSAPFDKKLWRELADAGILGIGIDESYGGAGLDFAAVCLVVEASAKHAAHLPIVEALCYGAPGIQRFGSKTLKEKYLPAIADGNCVMTAALSEWIGDVVVHDVVRVQAKRVGEGWIMTGKKACVPAGLIADAFIVSGETEGGEIGLFVVASKAPGVEILRQDGPAIPEGVVTFDQVKLDSEAYLGGKEVLSWIVDHAIGGLCIQESALCAGALALVSEYTKTREQFDKPIATFQAVGQRAADAYVDTEAIRLTAWQAAWRLSAGLPASKELAVAKFWAADGGQRVVHAAIHLHGGIGVDRDYPLHRFFLLTRQIELTLGGAHESLARLGSILAKEPA